jgi:hypothetical protein
MIEVVVHKFNMSDVEDPDLWAAHSFLEWEKSDKGSWIMENAKEPTWHRNPHQYGWQYTITASMEETQYTYYKLKYE